MSTAVLPARSRRRVRPFGIPLLATATVLCLLVLLPAGYAAAEVVDFWTWTGGTSYELENQILDLFRKERPDLTLNYDQKSVRNGDALLVAIVGDAAPDLVTTHQDWHRDFAAQSAFLDLRPFIERDGFDLSIFPAEIMKFYTGPNGEITGFPWLFTTIVLGYNKRVFDERAVPYPTADWDLDQMVAAARRLTVRDADQGSTTQWGLHVGVLWEYVWRLWGVTFMSEDGTRSNLSDPRAIDAFTWYAGLFLQEQVVHSETGGSSNLPDWVNGRIGMTLNWPHYLTAWGAQMTDEWDIEEIPTGPVGHKVARGATAGWAIPINANNPEGAWQVLKFLASHEAQMALLETGRGGVSLPAIAEFATNTAQAGGPRMFSNVQAYINSYQHASIDYYPPNFNSIRTQLLRPAVLRMQDGRAAPQSILPEIARQIEASVREYLAQ